MRISKLRRWRQRYGEILLDPALPAIHRRLQAVRSIESMVQSQTELLLHYGFARIEGDRVRRHLARVLAEICSLQPQGVLGLRLAQGIPNQRQQRVLADCVLQLSIGKVPVRFAVLAIPLGMEMRQACRAAELPGLAAKLHRFTPSAVAAERQTRFAGRDRRAVL